MIDLSRKGRIDGYWKIALDTARNRILLVGALFLVAFAVAAGRLVDVSLITGDGDRHRAGEPARPVSGSKPATIRAGIVDRNGTLLASSLSTASLIANPRRIRDPAAVAEQLAAALPGLDRGAVERKLASDRGFVWLRRHLTPNQHYRVNRMGIPGLAFREESRRMYPLGPLTSHVVGFTDIDGRGLSGIENHFDETLRAGGGSLALSIDVRVQHALASELGGALEKFGAIGGSGLIMDVDTGEILAMVSLPAFSPHAPDAVGREPRFNRTTLGIYEMGSTFKIFTTAMALDTGTAGLQDRYDATRPLRVSRFQIRDYKPKNRWLTVTEIFTYSSNIGTARMALAVGPDRHLEFMSRLGMLKPIRLEFSELGAPMSPPRWRRINSITVSYGYGLAVSPVHVVAGVSAVVNGGIYRDPTLLRREDGQAAAGRRVVSATTSDQMRRLLRLVVEKGTARKAGNSGYLIGGKTGTTEKASGGGYKRKSLLSSFVGVFPMHDPRYVIHLMLDEPKGNAETYGYATGGWVAAPTARSVIERIAPILGVPPVDENDSARTALALDLDGGRQVASR